MWLAPRLPMIDLPQHAAQVALWRDLLSGTSGWADIVRINLVTPYLIGYGAMLPLSLAVPLAVATRIVLTLAWFGFVMAGMALRRAVKAAVWLDWLLLWGFFGFAWHWGFLTFLVAAPLALLFVWAALVQARAPTLRRSLVLIAMGGVLLLSHGLLFLFALMLGGLLAIRGIALRGLASGLKIVPAHAVLLSLCAGFRLVSAGLEGSLRYDHVSYGVPLWMRIPALLIFVNDQGPTGWSLLILTLLVGACPWLLRCRIRGSEGAVIFAGIIVALLSIPSYAFETGFLFERFSLFLLPGYGLLFSAAPPAAAGASRRMSVLAILILSSWAMLGVQAARISGFRDESRSFETVLAAAQPGRRALSLIYDGASPAAANARAYMHFPAWYQAEKGGFVDFNFAAFPPQIVRFKAGRAPAVDQHVGLHPDLFDWRTSDGARYDYIFVRQRDGGEAARLIATSPCRFTVAAEDEPWVLLERQSCPVDP